METLIAQSNQNASAAQVTATTPQFVRFYCGETRIIDASMVEPHTADLLAVFHAVAHN